MLVVQLNDKEPLEAFKAINLYPRKFHTYGKYLYFGLNTNLSKGELNVLINAVIEYQNDRYEFCSIGSDVDSEYDYGRDGGIVENHYSYLEIAFERIK